MWYYTINIKYFIIIVTTYVATELLYFTVTKLACNTAYSQHHNDLLHSYIYSYVHISNIYTYTQTHVLLQ